MADNYSSQGLREMEPFINTFILNCGLPEGYINALEDYLYFSADLPEICNMIGHKIKELNLKLQEFQAEASKSILEFADATMENEQKANNDVGVVNDAMDNIKKMLDDINFQ